ncbi:DMT family transporter [Clostridiisalibacter paucivorans]|uniref:DMT family transporter n=1 Tax=Clostridiisalibacter paucivorans TaxID=408753 RepID=UPI0004789588|nr:DMT family transporter [Clostridiisalibacter paucivorans]
MTDKKKGIILILLSALFFAMMAATVKALENISVVEKMFFRNLFGLFVASFILFRKKQSLKGNNKKLLLLRSIFGLMGVGLYFYSLSSKIPLANAVMLNKMSPFFVIIFSFLFLNEKIKKTQIISLVLAIIGAGFVIKPRLTLTLVPSLSALFSALFAGVAYTIIRHLRHTDTSEIIVFYFTLLSTIITGPFVFYGNFVMPTGIEILLLFLLGLFATLAQFSMTNAYRFAPAGELSIYTYSNIVFSTFIGLTIWGEIPDSFSILGGIAIIVAGIINYYYGKQ